MAAERTHSGLRFWTLFLAGLSFLDLIVLVVVIILNAADPTNIYVAVMYPLFYIFAGGILSSIVAGLFFLMLRYPHHRKTLLVLLLVTTGVLVAHFYTINEPPTSSCYDNSKAVDGCVMDEIYYIPAAQALLTGEKCGPYADNCNLEHPFLSKAFIAAGIVLFGNDDFGWRFFIALLGTASIPILFAICWRVTRDSTLSLFAAYMLGFETLFFVHSSIAVIDVQAIFFALLAFLVYLSDLHLWKLNKFALAGMLLGLSALSKETAIFMVIFLVVYNLFFGDGNKRSRLFSSLQIFVITAVVFCVGLQIYVTLFGNSSMHTFVDDIRYIIDYGGSLKGNGWYDSVLHSYITPINWITFYTAVGYYVTKVPVGGTYYIVLGYWGIPNFFEVWLVFLWAPYVVYLAFKKWRSARAPTLPSMSESPVADPASVEVPADISASAPEASAKQTEPVSEEAPDPAFKLAGFALLWFAFTYFPYFAISAYGRVTYPFYLLPAIPAIAIGGAYLLTRRWFPREVSYVLLGGIFLWFFLYYPDKDFLPSWVRMLLGH